MLAVEGLAVFYGRIQAIHDFDLHVEKGEVVALIGANGAGKSTMINTISGLIPVRGGKITFQG
jgi:branched-chain amino acid transport system ATP-binding protein